VTLLQKAILILFYAVFFVTCGEAKEVVYSMPFSVNVEDKRAVYPKALLELSFSKMDSPYILVKDNVPMLQGRAFKSLGHNDGIDVVWSMTSNERESQYLPIRIPIYKGLVGLRLPLILKSSQQNFSITMTKQQLLSNIAGQGHDWPDTTILRAAGFSVLGPTTYDGLFGMLEKGRIDFFPRSVVEIWNELDMMHQDSDIVVEQNIALYYPTAMYFFVNKNNKSLFKVIKTGLWQAIKDGSFEALFLSVHKPFIEKANLSQRKIFHLNNPALPTQTPLTHSSLWYPLPKNNLTQLH
jgi:hypothetical protein